MSATNLIDVGSRVEIATGPYAGIVGYVQSRDGQLCVVHTFEPYLHLELIENLNPFSYGVVS